MKTQEEEARPIDRKGDRRKEKDGKTAITQMERDKRERQKRTNSKGSQTKIQAQRSKQYIKEIYREREKDKDRHKQRGRYKKDKDKETVRDRKKGIEKRKATDKQRRRIGLNRQTKRDIGKWLNKQTTIHS